jgi:uracil-DNA glycosylase family 4
MDPKAPLAHCNDCPLWDRPFVPGDGASETETVVVGEAPGKTEVLKGKPFVGDSGVLLEEELASIPIDPSSLYITNAVLCHPEGNKLRSIRPVRACHERLIWEIKQRGPKKVLALGAVAIWAVTGESRPIAELRLAGPLRSPFLGEDVEVGVTYHPGWVLRSRKSRRPHFASDIRQFLGP